MSRTDAVLDENRDFEWDENKRQANIEKHGIDFLAATEAFNDPKRLVFRSPIGEPEHRHVLVGSTQGRVIAIVYTLREDIIRLISARRARVKEVELWAKNES